MSASFFALGQGLGEGKSMSASPVPVEVPALPDDTQLSQHIPDWPIFSTIRAHLEGLTGQMLFSMGELGKDTLDELTALDTRLKKADPAFDKWYEGSPGWHAEKAAKFWSEWRIGTKAELTQVRKQINRIHGDYLKLRDDALAEETRKLEEQQRQQAEEERRREIKDLMTSGTPGAIHVAEQLAQEPLIPAAVSKEQAAIAANVPSTPTKISGRKVYDYEILDMEKFLRGVVSRPGLVPLLFSKQTDGSYRLSFAKFKSSYSSLTFMAKDILKITERYETANRGR